ncbi:germination protein, Ger(x)C family [Acididesulfobacillus acetoxydans]|uniref:Germination protein, Ger(X)C n=1 Tax=Acididesulfobacillus acetoxydans TaxID=1561005 RepID=A0A8S0VVN7_9FIRM|nr:Ger(x)C family spore germination protein [Acididesulfobacillus acetoxydans]CAA7599863.1 germination protein, Ger(x)C family [Acididesulfobacillus acetoxydans]CEJ07429.1 Germination protein, Ger(X)C [Acididesulfobacillus acetoxydans]
MKRRLLLVLALILTLSLGGCWGKVEVDQLGFVLAIGIDPGRSPGTYDVTYQMGLPKASQGGGGSNLDNMTLTVQARSMRESVQKVYNIASRRPFVGTVKVIVLGEDLAKEGVNRIIDFFQRYYEFRRTVFLVLAQGKASDLLDVQTQHEKMPALSLQGFMQEAGSTSTFPVTRLGHYLTVLGSGIEAPVIPVANPLKSGQEGVRYQAKTPGQAEEVHVGGAGVLNGDKLVSILTEEETRGYMWLQNEVKHRSITAELPGHNGQYFASARIITTHTAFRLEPDVNGGYSLHYTITGKWDLDEFYGPQKRLTPSEWLTTTAPVVNKAFTQVIQQECEAALRKSRELKLDFLGIGRIIEEQNPAYWKEIRNHWQATLPDFPVTVHIRIAPENAGSSFAPPTNPPGTGQD